MESARDAPLGPMFFNFTQFAVKKMAKTIGWRSHLCVGDPHVGNPGSDTRYHHLIRGVKCLVKREDNLPVHSVVSTLSMFIRSSKSGGGGYGKVFRLSNPKPKFSMRSSKFVWRSGPQIRSSSREIRFSGGESFQALKSKVKIFHEKFNSGGRGFQVLKSNALHEKFHI